MTKETTKKEADTPPETTAIDNSELLAKIELLEKRDAENQEKMKMLYEVADKGRVFNYESQKQQKKPIKVKLSIYNDKVIVGWRTIKDELIKSSTSGAIVGENQQYEIVLLDKEGQKEEVVLNGYPAFSDARYTNRIECEVISRAEDFQGNTTFDIAMDNGRVIKIDSRFIN